MWEWSSRGGTGMGSPRGVGEEGREREREKKEKEREQKGEL